jgi:hypothetical protein
MSLEDTVRVNAGRCSLFDQRLCAACVQLTVNRSTFSDMNLAALLHWQPD